jgi:hypothetical protein
MLLKVKGQLHAIWLWVYVMLCYAYVFPTPQHRPVKLAEEKNNYTINATLES